MDRCVVRNDEGFSLIEAIVALAVIGLVSMAVFDLLINPASRQAEDVKTLDRLISARQVLADVGTWQFISPGERQVKLDDGTVWKVRVTTVAESTHLRRIDVIPTGEDTAVLSSLLRVRGQ